VRSGFFWSVLLLRLVMVYVWICGTGWMDGWIDAKTNALQSLDDVLTLRAHVIAHDNHLTHPPQTAKQDQFEDDSLDFIRLDLFLLDT
jgi:hypothetical protein